MAKSTLTWTANQEPDVAGYEIWRSLGAEASVKLATVGKVTTYEDQAVPDVSQQVSYQLLCFDGKGNKSQKCAPVSITIDATAPATPVGLSVTVTVTVTPP